jgi:hypothetical protein
MVLMVHKVKEKGSSYSVKGIHKIEKEFFEKIKKMSNKELLAYLDKEQPFEAVESWDYGDANKFEEDYLNGFADWEENLETNSEDEEIYYSEDLIHMNNKWYQRVYDGDNNIWTLLRPKIREPIWTGKWRIKWSPMAGMQKILDPKVYKKKEDAEKECKRLTGEMKGLSEKNVERGGIPITTDAEVVKEMV